MIPPEIELVKLSPPSVLEGSVADVKLKVTVKQTSEEIRAVYADLSPIGSESRHKLVFAYPQTDLGPDYYTYTTELSSLGKVKPGEYNIKVTCEDVTGRSAQTQTVVLTIEEDYSLSDNTEPDDEFSFDFGGMRDLWIGVLVIIILLIIIILVMRRNY
jgi:hypothetical protein